MLHYEYQNAIFYLDRAKQLEPDSLQVMDAEAGFYLHAHAYEQALTLYNEAIKLHPDSAKLYLNRGVVYSRLGKNEEALTGYNLALELDPDFAIAYINRASVTEILNLSSAEALADAEHALSLAPNNPDILSRVAGFYGQIGDWQQAADLYYRAGSLNPHNYYHVSNTAYCLAQLGMYEEALLLMESAVEMGQAQNDVFILEQLTNVYGIKGDWQAVVNVLSLTIADSPYATAYYKRGYAYYRLEQYEEALADFDRALEIVSTEPNYLLARARTCFQLGMFEEGQLDINVVIVVNPGSITRADDGWNSTKVDPMNYLPLAMTYDAFDVEDFAYQFYRDFLDDFGNRDDDVTRFARERLEALDGAL